MNTMLRPILELTVMISGILLAYLPVQTYLKQEPWKLAAWLAPLLTGTCILEGALCYFLNISTGLVLFLTLPVLMVIYHKTLRISIWKSASIFLAVCAVFACVNSLSRAVNAIVAAQLGLPETELWFHTSAGIFYNGICLLFVIAAWYPASHAARTMIEDENFAQTWYIFWILPLIFIGLNLFMIPRYKGTLYTGRILQGYIVISLVLLVILVLFYAMFLLMANSLNKNARLQQENHLLSLQQTRYENLCTAIEAARQARHDIRHHFLQLSSLAEKGDLEKIKEYLSIASSKIPDQNLHFCENQAADSVISHYAALARRTEIPFHVKADLPARVPVDEIDMCLVLSNLLENAIEASLKTAPSRRKINAEIYLHHERLLLIQVENTFDGKIQKKNHIFQSSKRAGNGVGIQSIRHIAEKNGGDCNFTYENGIFTAKIMLRVSPKPSAASSPR
ncbi:GHKL domain-containing protein [Blautia sp. Sow4_E7]|uniref:GHKL domain-containing protein n=1 Tax=Blautia sp. Sow4_E7 TaxID=3438749 RepID=UPI003F8EB883